MSDNSRAWTVCVCKFFLCVCFFCFFSVSVCVSVCIFPIRVTVRAWRWPVPTGTQYQHFYILLFGILRHFLAHWNFSQAARTLLCPQPAETENGKDQVPIHTPTYEQHVNGKYWSQCWQMNAGNPGVQAWWASRLHRTKNKKIKNYNQERPYRGRDLRPFTEAGEMHHLLPKKR